MLIYRVCVLQVGAIAIAGTLSDLHCEQHNEQLVLSPQPIISCAGHKDSCETTNSTIMTEALDYVKTKGIPSTKCAKYTSQYTGEIEKCTEKCDDGEGDSKTYKISGYEVLDGVDSVKSFIVENGTILFTYELYDSLLKYTNGVYNNEEDDKLIGFHASRIFGWGTDDDGEYWIASNSFSTNWGMNGYFYIRTTSTAIQELYAIYIDKEEASEDDE